MPFPKAIFIIAIPFACIFASSCRNETPKRKNATVLFNTEAYSGKDFAAHCRAATATLADSGRFAAGRQMQRLYEAADYNAVWLRDDGTAMLADSLLADIEQMKDDGINTGRYHLQSLKEKVNTFTKGQKMNIADIVALDTALSLSYIKASKDLLFGMIKPASVDSLWFHTNDSSWNMEQSIATIAGGRYFSLDSFRSRIPAYHLLSKALGHYRALANDTAMQQLKLAVHEANPSDSIIKDIIQKEAPWLRPISDTLTGTMATIQAYQQLYGLKRTGKKDSLTLAQLSAPEVKNIALISANMERLRWMPQTIDATNVTVNIPMMELVLRRDGQEVLRMNVVVGKPVRQTPALNANMANVVINPPWGVPPTILKKDVLPGVMHSGAAYLRKKGLKVYDRKGNQIDAGNITASNYRNYTFRQPPGARNALGEIKFNLPNKWDIYLHDTPHREDFTKYNRAQSSGCIRVQRPKEMAEYILAEIEGKRYTPERIDSVIKTRNTRFETLSSRIPVHIIYLTAYEDATGNNIRFARDIYDRDNKLMAAIGE